MTGGGNSLKYCLWLYEKKVYSLAEVIENFDVDSLSAYLFGGSLGKWLRSIGCDEIAESVEKINLNSDVCRQLKSCFGLEAKADKNDVNTDFPIPEYALEYHPFDSAAAQTRHDDNSVSAAKPTLHIDGLSSFSASFSGSLGSLYSSFSLLYSSSAFLPGNFMSGGSLTGGSYGSFPLPVRTSSGSYIIPQYHAEISEREYRQTMLNLSSCPLNSRGYGIHVI